MQRARLLNVRRWGPRRAHAARATRLSGQQPAHKTDLDNEVYPSAQLNAPNTGVVALCRRPRRPDDNRSGSRDRH